MLKKCILFLTLATSSASFAAAPQNCCEPVCCEQKVDECCKPSCLSTCGLITGTAIAAVVGGAIAGAVAQPRKKGHKGHKGATGPVPVFTRDVGQNISFDVTLELDIAGASPEIVLIPFLTDPVGNTQTLAPITVNTAGPFVTPVQNFIYNDPYNGTYYWGFMVQAKNANGTVINIFNAATDWIATPSRFPEPEIGILFTDVNPLINTDVLLTVQVPAYVVYDAHEF